MKFEDVDSQLCSIARALSVIGDGWSLMLVRDAFYGRRRFSDFVTYTGAQKTVVSDRLRCLVAAGIFERVEYQQHPTRHEYRLTDKGRDLTGVMLSLMAWGDRWLDGDDGPPIEVTHTSCDHDADPRVVCGHCHAELALEHLRSGPGPGFPERGPRIFTLDPDDRDERHAG
ncbi:MAG: helix-turn-helix domain-containing protein [Acidimicrobiales bacterium]